MNIINADCMKVIGDIVKDNPNAIKTSSTLNLQKKE